MIQVEELKDIIGQLVELKRLFKASPSMGDFLETGHQAKFVRLVTDARALINEALTPANDYVVQLIFTVNNGSGGYLGGPSLACVAEVEQLLRGAVRTIERREQAKPLEFAKAATRAPYVDPMRVFELHGLHGKAWDYSKLIRLCGELNIANENDCYYAVAMLVRAITDHVAPVFGCTKFGQVVANYKGTRSFKEQMTHLDSGLRKIADAFLHEQIRTREATPNATQVDFRQSLDVLLSEVVRIA